MLASYAVSLIAVTDSFCVSVGKTEEVSVGILELDGLRCVSPDPHVASNDVLS